MENLKNKKWKEIEKLTESTVMPIPVKTKVDLGIEAIKAVKELLIWLIGAGVVYSALVSLA